MTTGDEHSSGPSQVQLLMQLALSGMSNMFYSERNLFCHRVVRTHCGLIKEDISPRYTIMCLLGLNRAASAGFESSIDTRPVLAALKADESWINNIGDFGLYLCLLALESRGDLTRIVSNGGLDKVLQRYPIMASRTMEIAWFLAGLSDVQRSGVTALPNVADVAFQTYRLLRNNQGPHGLFGHQSPRGVAGKIRGRFGSFADQVYPIHALSKFGQAFGVNEALQEATHCADAICQLQGPLGQWWWHYDSRTGRVAGKYPVYSVHQDAMAPLALFALSEATGKDFGEPIFRGLQWIAGNNELKIDLRDFSNNLVWRSVYQSRPRSAINQMLQLGGFSASSTGLRVRYEDRPYHLGWVLYAFAPSATGACQTSAAPVYSTAQ